MACKKIDHRARTIVGLFAMIYTKKNKKNIYEEHGIYMTYKKNIIGPLHQKPTT